MLSMYKANKGVVCLFVFVGFVLSHVSFKPFFQDKSIESSSTHLLLEKTNVAAMYWVTAKELK